MTSLRIKASELTETTRLAAMMTTACVLPGRDGWRVVRASAGIGTFGQGSTMSHGTRTSNDDDGGTG